MASRRHAREITLRMLFQCDLNKDVDLSTVQSMIDQEIGNPDLRQFAWSLFTGVMESRAQLDDRIESISDNWTLGRMAAADRNIIRLGAFELLSTDTPNRVAIDEAIELSKRYGTEQSPQFVNGILDRLFPGNESSEAKDGSTE